MASLRTVVVLAFLAVATDVPGARAACDAPEPVCAAADRVFRIAAYDPHASAVVVGNDLLVTNRHVVADNAEAEVILPDGRTVTAVVVPTAYAGDLILLRAPGLDGTPPLPVAPTDGETDLYAIGSDIGRGSVRVYAPGRLIWPLAENAPRARYHHTAVSGPGNSGGALVDSDGRLVGIVISGGEGRNEAIPAAEIAKLRSASGPEHADESAAIGRAYRSCDTALNAIATGRPRPSDAALAGLEVCRDTGNRQFLDLVGQAEGRAGRLDTAAKTFERALAIDPSAVNTLISSAITLHLARRYADELPLLRRLIAAMPDDAQVLRLALQAGHWGGDDALRDQAMALIETHHPALAPAARGFRDNAPRTPPGRPR